MTTIDELVGVDLSKIDQDKNGHLWIGGSSPDGFIQIYDPVKKESVIHFDFGLTGILDIKVLDSLAFVFFIDGQDIGIMKYFKFFKKSSLINLIVISERIIVLKPIKKITTLYLG